MLLGETVATGPGSVSGGSLSEMCVLVVIDEMVPGLCLGRYLTALPVLEARTGAVAEKPAACGFGLVCRLVPRAMAAVPYRYRKRSKEPPLDRASHHAL